MKFRIGNTVYHKTLDLGRGKVRFIDPVEHQSDSANRFILLTRDARNSHRNRGGSTCTSIAQVKPGGTVCSRHATLQGPPQYSSSVRYGTSCQMRTSASATAFSICPPAPSSCDDADSVNKANPLANASKQHYPFPARVTTNRTFGSGAV